MEHNSLRVSMITDRHSEVIQLCSLTCQFTNLIEAHRLDQSAFLKSTGSKALQIRFMDWQIGGEWQNGLEVFTVIIQCSDRT